jgi:UDP-glucose 4-epimerase
MKVLVTGGAGFIGSHLTDRLIGEGHQVVVVDNLSTGKKKNLHPDATFYKVDILSSRLERVFEKEKPQLICHYAAQMDVRKSVENPAFDAQNNIIGLLNILEAAVKNRTRRVIFASSGGAIYGEQTAYPASEEHSTHPISPYGVSKLASEQYLYYYQKVCGLDYTVLRFANVYGPRQSPEGEAGVVAIFSNLLIQNQQPIINGNGMQTRDYVFVEDVIDANMAVIYNDAHDTFNVGTGKETSVNDLFEALIAGTGSNAKMVHGPKKKGEQLRSCLDWGKLNRTLGWEPRFSLKEGLTKTIAYFRED